MFACSYFVELLVKVFATVRYTLEKSEGGFAIFIIIIPESYGFNNYPLKLITYEYTPRIQLFSYKERLSIVIILVDMYAKWNVPYNFPIGLNPGKISGTFRCGRS